MGWYEVIQDLEVKLEGLFQGTYRPVDNVPFIRVQYPPDQEREALRQFALLAERLRQRGRVVMLVSITEAFHQALARLLNCSSKELLERLRELEPSRGRGELRQQLSEHLPDELVTTMFERLRDTPREGVAILVRTGSLYPLMRLSSLISRLEGRVECALVLAQSPSDTRPADLRGGYYRGETIAWR